MRITEKKLSLFCNYCLILVSLQTYKVLRKHGNKKLILTKPSLKRDYDSSTYVTPWKWVKNFLTVYPASSKMFFRLMTSCSLPNRRFSSFPKSLLLINNTLALLTTTL